MERLSIEEVIGHCKRHTEREERRTGIVELEKGDMEPVCMKEYWEHRQVAEWLTELKEYRSLGTPEQLRVIDELYLEKCEEVNQLKAQLAAAPTLEELETKLLNKVCIGCGYLKNNVCEYKGANCVVSKPIYGYIKEVFAEFRKDGIE